MRYAIELTPDDNDTFLVTCPDLPEVTTFGEDEAEAVMRASDAIATVLAGRISDRENIPAPTTAGRWYAAIPALSAAKVELYRAMKAGGVGKAELARRLGWHLPQVDRVLDLNHASRLDQIEAALGALGRELEITVKEAA